MSALKEATNFTNCTNFSLWSVGRLSQLWGLFSVDSRISANSHALRENPGQFVANPPLAQPDPEI
jgi:hypothetical protein